ncbi:stage III sporulation protein AE [Sedimentibacter acidaminivorans]|uniref:Stage III sporulation protein AE n=1 Tax=Sedimentibacter acidaminivorans TaxID=913099 RepID=A0ABS4GCL8_9FIRM|nr:stage III sporulation protein AE [Sedimentibacter acidaminivorans]MBP1925428.1 stage III sporulation protein AE [Sedimentibacter acidaminivorans]
MKIKKKTEVKTKIVVLFIIFMFFNLNYVFGDETDYINKAVDEIPTDDLENYLKYNNSYFSDKNIDIKSLIQNAFKGRLDISLKDYVLYEIQMEKDFFKGIFKTCINVLVICLLLTIINYFSDEINNQSVSDIVTFFSVIIIFTIILNDVNNLKYMLKSDFVKFRTVTENINGLFLAAMLTFGKLSILQFFQTYMNYIIGITTQLIYNFTDIMTVIIISVVLINNVSKLINAKLLFKLLKKGTLIILSGYIIIVVINFSVQGYILYKTDNIFISSVKALSPSSIPFIGSAVTSFFGVFFKSLLMIKDVLGIILIVFIFSAFGGSLIKIFAVFIMYKVTSVLIEPINENVSKLIYEMSDIFYIYLVCMITPIVIVTVYYSILLNYLNNIFG